MRKPIIVIIAIIALCCPYIAQAEERTGVDLLNGCRKIIALVENKDLSSKDEKDAIFWTGYILATVEAHFLLFVENDNWICLPETNLKTEQITRILLKYLNDHPDILHASANNLISMIMHWTYPCEQKDETQVWDLTQEGWEDFINPKK